MSTLRAGLVAALLLVVSACGDPITAPSPEQPVARYVGNSGPRQLSALLYPTGITENGWVVGAGPEINTPIQGRIGGAFSPVPSLTWAPGINNQLQIVGNSGNGKAGIWSEREGLFEIPTPLGAEGAAINNRGDVAGTLVTSELEQRAFFWNARDGVIEIPLPETPPADVLTVRAFVTDVNDRGEVIGIVEYLSEASDRRIGFIWSAALGSRVLGDLGGLQTTPHGINNRGEVVGSATIAFPQSHIRPFIWTEAGGIQELSFPGLTAQAYDINASGVIVGASDIVGEDGFVAVYWDRNREVHVLPESRNTQYCVGPRINNSGVVVGVAGTPGQQVTLVWTVR